MPSSRAGVRAVAHADALERERERFLAAIVDSAEDAIFAKALDGTILSWNAAAQRMYGYAPDEIVGSPVFRLAPPERHAEIQEFLRRLARGESIQHFETERVRRNGERFPVSLAISPVRGAAGEIVGASTIARDISEARRLTEAIAFQRSMLQAQSEASLDGIEVVDPTGGVIYANRRFAEMWRLPTDVIESRAGDVLLGAMSRLVADLDAFMGPVRAAADRTTEPTRDTVHLLDGRVLDRYSAPILGAGGQDRGRVWYFRDVTAETTRLAQLRALIATIDDAAFVFGPDGAVLLRNPASRVLLPQIVTEQDLRAIAGSAGAGGVPLGPGAAIADAESVADTPIGPRRVLITIRPVSDSLPETSAPEGHGRAPTGRLLGWLGLVRDVTELRETQASREAFLGVLSHELRTPITTIFGGAKMLLRQELQSDRDELLRDIAAEADRLYRLVEDLLVLTRIEREALQLTDQPLLIGPIVERVVAAERAREPHAELRATIADALPMVRGEDTYVEQIVRNLVGNAVKYGRPGGPVDVVVEHGGRSVLVRVLDEGPGIADEESDRVFELLYRSPATAAQAAGSGIGLFVSRRLAEAMDGSVRAQRRPDGRGSEFTLELALYEEPPES